MDADLEELVKGYGGYGMESWMKDCYRSMAQKVQELRDAIRAHRDERGHDRCWLDDQKLYQSLPEAYPGDLQLPPKAEFIQNCHRYWEHRQDPSVVFLRQKDVDEGRMPEGMKTTMSSGDKTTWVPVPTIPVPGTRWQHFKGGFYIVLFVARDSEDPNKFRVCYQNEEDGTVWDREHSSFMGLNDKGAPRFELRK